MGSRTIICTAGDNQFLKISLGLLRSVRERQEQDVDIGYLDLGLSDASRTALSEFGVKLAAPGWDLPVRVESEVARIVGDGFKAMVARPFLRDHFPGYDTYIWIDADAWIQNWWAVEWLIEGARRGNICIAPEMDRAYKHSFNFRNYVAWTMKELTRFYGEEKAKQVGYNPVLNVGVFSVPAAHPIWSAWVERMREAAAQEVGFYVDQLSLNCALYGSDFSRCFLPSTFNWLSNMALPAFDPATAEFVEPDIPHRPIGILHLSGSEKFRPQQIKVVGADAPMETKLLYDPSRKPPGPRGDAG